MILHRPQKARGQLPALARGALNLVVFLATHLRRVAAKLLTLLPHLLPRSMRLASNKATHELHPTAYLDALRGYAAWAVYNSHVIPGRWRPETAPLMQYSIPKVLFRGQPNVYIFFVISGFALTYGVLGHMHNNQPARVLDSLASSIFRRHLRLNLPIIFASLVTMLAMYTGIAVQGVPVLQPTFLGNVRYWILDTVRSLDPFPHVVAWWFKGVKVTHTEYLPQAWTIPIEFRGSMMLFVFCVPVCKMTAQKRMWTTLACAFACFWWVAPWAGLFFYGMWLADRRHLRTRQRQSPTLLPVITLTGSTDVQPLDSIKQEKDAEHDPGTESLGQRFRTWSQCQWMGSSCSISLSSKQPTLIRQLPCIILFGLAFVLLAAPEVMQTTSPFPYSIMAWTYPPNWRLNGRAMPHWPTAIGAMMLSYAIDHSPLLQRPLVTQFSQFLGELSFGIYVMHNIVRWMMWERFLVGWQTEHFGESHWCQLPGYIVMSICVLWAAELFRMVDVRCVRFTRQLQNMLFTS